MIKYFCDACGMEMKNRGKEFSYLCHLDEIKPSYGDADGNGISGRSIESNLCNACYNIIMGEAVKKFKKLQKANGIPSVKQEFKFSITPINVK